MFLKKFPSLLKRIGGKVGDAIDDAFERKIRAVTRVVLDELDEYELTINGIKISLQPKPDHPDISG